MRKQNPAKKKVIIVVILLLAIAAIAVLLAVICSKKSVALPLSEYWTAESEPAQRLREYVTRVTDPKDETNFIPEKDRIAVFDMDGTLTCETFYTYYDTMMFIEFCLHDHPERVSDELKAVAASIKPGYVAD